jgi:hypothetical protein
MGCKTKMERQRNIEPSQRRRSFYVVPVMNWRQILICQSDIYYQGRHLSRASIASPHGDVALRNFVIDEESKKVRAIDFGQASEINQESKPALEIKHVNDHFVEAFPKYFDRNQ